MLEVFGLVFRAKLFQFVTAFCLLLMAGQKVEAVAPMQDVACKRIASAISEAGQQKLDSLTATDSP